MMDPYKVLGISKRKITRESDLVVVEHRVQQLLKRRKYDEDKVADVKAAYAMLRKSLKAKSDEEQEGAVGGSRHGHELGKQFNRQTQQAIFQSQDQVTLDRMKEKMKDHTPCSGPAVSRKEPTGRMAAAGQQIGNSAASISSGPHASSPIVTAAVQHSLPTKDAMLMMYPRIPFTPRSLTLKVDQVVASCAPELMRRAQLEALQQVVVSEACCLSVWAYEVHATCAQGVRKMMSNHLRKICTSFCNSCFQASGTPATWLLPSEPLLHEMHARSWNGPSAEHQLNAELSLVEKSIATWRALLSEDFSTLREPNDCLAKLCLKHFDVLARTVRPHDFHRQPTAVAISRTETHVQELRSLVLAWGKAGFCPVLG